MKLYNFNNINHGPCYSVMANSQEDAIKYVKLRLEQIHPLYDIIIKSKSSKNYTNEILLIKLKSKGSDGYGILEWVEVREYAEGQVLETEWN